MNKFDLFEVFEKRWKVFLLSLVAQFLISSLLYLGIHLPAVFNILSFSDLQAETSLLSPVTTSDNFEPVRVKLEEKKNTFQLNPDSIRAEEKTSFIPSAYAASEYDLASSYAVVDLGSGDVLASKSLNEKVAIASLTKIMTAVVALDLASPDELFTISERAAAKQPTKIGVVAGQKMNLEELLQALMMTSANDAAEVIKEGIDKKFGGQVFIRAMNEKAEFLGLKNTKFANPQGLDAKNQYSSAADLAILSHYALENYSLIKDISQKDYLPLPADRNHKQFDLYNWNGLLGVYPGVYGIKIGNTGDAGYTTVVASQREGRNLLAVILGAPGVLERDLWAAQLLNLGFKAFGLPSAQVTEEDLQQKYSTWRYWG